MIAINTRPTHKALGLPILLKVDTAHHKVDTLRHHRCLVMEVRIRFLDTLIFQRKQIFCVLQVSILRLFDALRESDREQMKKKRNLMLEIVFSSLL
jgi:hypothetical protein